MKDRAYEFKTMPNGLLMMAIKPINDTGIAEAYITIRDNPLGNSKGDTGAYSCNVYKALGLQEGILDYKLACEALNVSPNEVITNRLTAITNKVRVVDESSLIGYDILNEAEAPRADGLVTQSSKVTLMNYAADCVVVFLLDPNHGGVVGTFHASWKGLLIGIVEREIDTFVKDFNTDPKDLIAVVCPSISMEAFEVDIDCANRFTDAGFNTCVDYTSYDKPHVDLQKVTQQILLSCGLTNGNVHVIDDFCTYRDAKLFHSYRRGPIDAQGRHLNGMNAYFIRLLK